MANPVETVFITDLPPTIDEATLLSVFGAYGTIKSHKLFPASQRGQGNALISFASVDEAKWLVENLSGNQPQGLDQPVTINYKTENWKKATGQFGKGGWGGMDGGWGGDGGMDGGWGGGKDGGWGGGKGGGKGGGAGPSATLFFGDLPADLTDERLKTIFGAYGSIVSHKVLPVGTSGKCAAIISFDSASTAQWIVENLNGNIPQGLTEPIMAKYKDERAKGGGGWGGGGFGGGGGAWGGAGGGAAWGGASQDSWSPPAAWANKAAKGGSPTGGGAPMPKVDPSQTLFVADLPLTMDEETLKTTLGAYGTVTSVKMLNPGASGAAALVNLASAEEANWMAENLNENIPQGLSTPIKCKLKSPKVEGGKGWGWSPY